MTVVVNSGSTAVVVVATLVLAATVAAVLIAELIAVAIGEGAEGAGCVIDGMHN